MDRTREYCTLIFLSSALLVRILHATFIFVTTLKTFLSHIPHCWKSHAMAQIWTSLLFFREMLRSAITYLFCFGGKSTGVDLFAN